MAAVFTPWKVVYILTKKEGASGVILVKTEPLSLVVMTDPAIRGLHTVLLGVLEPSDLPVALSQTPSVVEHIAYIHTNIPSTLTKSETL